MAEMTLKVTTAEYGVKFYAEASPISYTEYANNVRFIFRLYKNGNSVDYKSVRATYLEEDKWSASYENNSLERGSKYTYSVSATTVSTSPSVDFATNRGEFTPWRENKHLVGKEAYSLDYDNAKNSYTKVRIVIDENADPYEYGTDVGRTLEIKNPWVAYPPESEEARDRTIHAYADDVAQDILTRVNGYSYQPFDAKGAFLSDDAELGDAVWFEGVYGAIVSQDITFDGLGNSDASAPNGEDNENEFGDYVPSADNSVDGKLERLRTSFIVEYGHIRSEISSVESELSSAIDQRLDEITLSVSSANGSTTFTLKDGEATLDTKTLNLTVDHANISGLLTASQIDVSTLHVGSGGISVDNGAISWAKLDDSTQTTINGAVNDASDALDAAQTAENTVAGWTYTGSTYIDGSQIQTGTVTASTLQAGKVALLDYYGTTRGNFDLTATESGIGVVVNSDTGLKLNATTNVSINAGSGGELTLRDSHLIFTSTGIRLSSHCFGSTFPTDADYGELYFKLVT